MICPSCRSEVPGSPKFCNKCGAPMAAAASAPPPAEAATKVCPKCGTANPASAKFCKKDGYAFNGASATPAAAAPKPQAPPPPRPPAPPVPRPQTAAPPPSQAAIPGSVACPTCGTLNPPNAKFCKKDGTALGAPGRPAAAAPPVSPLAPPKASMPIELSLERDPLPRPVPSPVAPPPPPPPPPPPRVQPAPSASMSQPIAARQRPEPQPPRPEPAPDTTQVTALKRGKGRMIVVIVAFVVLAAGAAGFLYWKGILGNRQDSVAETIMAAAREKGFEGITVTVTPTWVANVSGTVIGQVRKDELLALVQQNASVKGVQDELTVKPGPGELEQQVADALNARGLSSVTVSVGTDLIAMLKGTVDDPTLETVAVDTARGVTGLKDVQSAIKVSVAARQAALTQALAGAGYNKATAEMADENTVNVAGTVYSQEEKDKLLELVTATAGVVTVNDTTQIIDRPVVIDSAKIEADINKQLQKAGLGAVAAVVDPQFNATLVGTVSKVADRDRALKTARKVTAIKSLRSEIEVAGAVVHVPAATAVLETMTLNAVKGQWVGKVDTGILNHPFTLNITGGAVGQDIGTTVYGAGKGMCGGTLKLAEASGSDFTFVENIDRTALMCPGGGTLKMRLAGDAKALFEWYRPKNPTKRYAKGSAVRR